MKAKNFDQTFDKGEAISTHLDLSRKRRPELEQKRAMTISPSG